MAHQSSTTVHTRIGHERALCGLAPRHGNYTILSFSEFVAANEEKQCGRCLYHLGRRGYNIEAEREKAKATIRRYLSESQTYQPAA